MNRSLVNLKAPQNWIRPWDGDVKYHMGFGSKVTTASGKETSFEVNAESFASRSSRSIGDRFCKSKSRCYL